MNYAISNQQQYISDLKAWLTKWKIKKYRPQNFSNFNKKNVSFLET